MENPLLGTSNFVTGPNLPIGVFDSGVGGLTVFKAIQKSLPRENIIYYGDTAHLPYGSKSPQTLKKFSLKIGKFLESQKIKLLVVACNSASSVAIPLLRRNLKVPVLGVIEPGAKLAAQRTSRGRIGVIGTEGTIASQVYPKRLTQFRRGVRVFSVACPLFVPLVEEGFWRGAITEAIARRYLAPLKKWRPDTLILGCTHYPLLKKVISERVGRKVVLVDSGEAAAEEVSKILQRKKLLRKNGRGSYKFYASDAPTKFKKLAHKLLGLSMKRVWVQRFD
ncbi:MAG: glutamate racemase [Elusimicrobia bacterium]|nr:glutamate racemase [Elusimicrobiota bacterium]